MLSSEDSSICSKGPNPRAPWRDKIKDLIEENELDPAVRKIIHDYVFLQETRKKKYARNCLNHIHHLLRANAIKTKEERLVAWNSLYEELKEETKEKKEVAFRHNRGKVADYYAFARSYVFSNMTLSEAQYTLSLYTTSSRHDARLKKLNEELYQKFILENPAHNDCSRDAFLHGGHAMQNSTQNISLKNVCKNQAQQTQRKSYSVV